MAQLMNGKEMRTWYIEERHSGVKQQLRNRELTLRAMGKTSSPMFRSLWRCRGGRRLIPTDGCGVTS